MTWRDLRGWKRHCWRVYRGGVAPVACETGTRFEDSVRPVFMVGVGRFARIASFFRREARRPRMLDTTVANVRDQFFFSYWLDT